MGDATCFSAASHRSASSSRKAMHPTPRRRVLVLCLCQLSLCGLSELAPGAPLAHSSSSSAASLPRLLQQLRPPGSGAGLGSIGGLHRRLDRRLAARGHCSCFWTAASSDHPSSAPRRVPPAPPRRPGGRRTRAASTSLDASVPHRDPCPILHLPFRVRDALRSRAKTTGQGKVPKASGGRRWHGRGCCCGRDGHDDQGPQHAPAAPWALSRSLIPPLPPARGARQALTALFC